MKKVLLITILAMFAIFSVGSAFAFITKGDTLVVEQADADAVPLNEIIDADTLADGSQAHAVYELVPDGWFSLSAPINAATFDLNLVGGKRADDQARPVILVKLDYGGWGMISASKDFTMKGIHLMQAAETSGGNIGPWARSGVSLGDTNQTVILHDLIWDFNTGFQLWGAKDGLKLSMTNCLTRFSGSTTNTRWDGQGICIDGAVLDTVILQNCTWYGGHTFFLAIGEADINCFKMDHCTIVNYTNFPIWGFYWDNTEFTNNLWYNAFACGEDFTARIGQDPDELPYGVLNIDTLYVDSLGTVNTAMEAARSMLVANNNNFVQQNLKDFWGTAMADTAYHGFQVADPSINDGFMNSRTLAMFADDATWPELVLENTTSLDPMFTNYPDLSDSLIQYSKAMWTGATGTKLFTDPDGDPLIPTDPMIYDLSYSNPTLLTASTTGDPVGDLTWFSENGYNTVNMTTGIEAKGAINAKSFVLEQNYPNPFNPETQIKYTLNKTADVKINVYNMLGQKVRTLVNKQMTSGSHTVKFNGLNDQGQKLSSGMYVYQIQFGDLKETRKMMLMK